MFILCGAVVAVSWIVALAAAIPPRAAVADERIGVAELEAHDLTRAETEFAGVLELAPRSADARLGLACALWAQKRASGAAIESVIAIEDGLVYPDDASCGSLGSFAGLFSRDDFGPAVVLLVPRAAPAGMTMARAIGMIGRGSVANGTNQLETIHVMAAACLAWRDGLYGLSLQYTDVAAGDYGAGRAALAGFLQCVGNEDTREILCASIATYLGQCEFRNQIAEAIHADDLLGHI